MKFSKIFTAVLTFVFLTFTLSTNAQNSGWALPGNYAKFPSNPNQNPTIYSLPAPGGSYGYNGNPATYASNMVLDANNNIQFFIVDGKIYNGSGILTGKIKENGVGPIMAGNSELPIVQDPGNCRRCYI